MESDGCRTEGMCGWVLLSAVNRLSRCKQLGFWSWYHHVVLSGVPIALCRLPVPVLCIVCPIAQDPSAPTTCSVKWRETEDVSFSWTVLPSPSVTVRSISTHCSWPPTLWLGTNAGSRRRRRTFGLCKCYKRTIEQDARVGLLVRRTVFESGLTWY